MKARVLHFTRRDAPLCVMMDRGGCEANVRVRSDDVAFCSTMRGRWHLSITDLVRAACSLRLAASRYQSHTSCMFASSGYITISGRARWCGSARAGQGSSTTERSASGPGDGATQHRDAAARGGPLSTPLVRKDTSFKGPGLEEEPLQVRGTVEQGEGLGRDSPVLNGVQRECTKRVQNEERNGGGMGIDWYPEDPNRGMIDLC